MYECCVVLCADEHDKWCDIINLNDQSNLEHKGTTVVRREIAFICMTVKGFACKYTPNPKKNSYFLYVKKNVFIHSQRHIDTN